MKLTLNLMDRQVKPFEEYVLRHVICSFYIFYTKKPIHSGMTEIWLYCRPQDEVTLAYHIGIAAGSAMFHRPKKYWENQIHDVAKPFPESYLIDIELPDFSSEFIETPQNSANYISKADQEMKILEWLTKQGYDRKFSQQMAPVILNFVKSKEK